MTKSLPVSAYGEYPIVKVTPLALPPLSHPPQAAVDTCLPARARRPLSRLHEQQRCDYRLPAAVFHAGDCGDGDVGAADSPLLP